MTAQKKPPNKVTNDKVVSADDLHERRVKRLLKEGVTDMNAGETSVFPMHKLIEAESGRMQAEIEAFKRKRKKKR